MTCSNSAFVITENGDFAVGVVISLHSLLDRASGLHLFEKPGHGVGCVVSTEDLRRKSSHVTVQVLVESRSLHALAALSVT